MVENAELGVSGAVTEDLPIHLGGLFDNGEVRYHDDNAPQSVFLGVGQGESEHGQRFSAAGGGTEGEQTLRHSGSMNAGIVQVCPQLINVSGCSGCFPQRCKIRF
jgi:hypothetical protein